MSMEFLPRLFDSFSRERIPCEKQKNSSDDTRNRDSNSRVSTTLGQARL